MSDMARQRDILESKEALAFSKFVAFAASQWASSQSELAQMAGVSPGMISTVISGSKKAGGRTLRGISQATGIPAEDIVSGVGLERLKARVKNGGDREADEQRLRAVNALAVLYDLKFDVVSKLFDEIGVSLPANVPATTWFDVGRAALERRRHGLPLTRQLSP